MRFTGPETHRNFFNVSDAPRQTFRPPDPRSFVVPGVYLAEWCAAQPERGTHEKIEELAGLAGCSSTTIRHVIRGSRALSPRCARALVAQLGLPEDQAAHLLDIFELPHLPPAMAQNRRRAVLTRVADQSGVQMGPSSALITDERDEAAVVAGLAVALGSLESDRPTTRVLLRGAVPAMTLKDLDAASAQRPTGERAAPRLIALDPPVRSKPAALAHHGALAFAAEGLMRLPASERDFRCFTASIDEEGFLALEEPCRALAEGQRALCEAGEVRLPSRVVLQQVQRFVAAGPFQAGGSAGEVGWMRPSAAPSAASADPALLERPHPTGITWFPTWVAVWRAWAERAGKPHSDGWLAARTKLSRSTVQELCSGVGRFNSSHVVPFVNAFGLAGDAAAKVAFEGMAMVAMASGDVAHQAQVIRALRDMGLEQGRRNPAGEAHFVQARWHARVIYNLPDLGGFQPLHGWICRALKGRLDWGEAQQVLDALAALGLLRTDGQGRTVAVEPEVQVEGPHAAAAQYELFHGLLRLYRAELDQRDPDLTLNAWMMALPDHALPELSRLCTAWDASVFRVLREAQARRKQGKAMDRVVLVSRQCLPIFRLPAWRRGPGTRITPRGLAAEGA